MKNIVFEKIRQENGNQTPYEMCAPRNSLERVMGHVCARNGIVFLYIYKFFLLLFVDLRYPIYTLGWAHYCNIAIVFQTNLIPFFFVINYLLQ